MKFSKSLSLLAAVVLTGSMISGCGAGKPASDAAAPAADASQSAAANGGSAEFKVADKPITINLWDIATEDPAKTNQEGAVSRFIAAHPNVTVNQTHIQNDTYKQKLVVAMSSGQCPDMYIHWGGGPMNEYIDAGFAVPITDLMKNHCNVKFLKAAVEQSSYKGEIYAVPFGGIGGSGVFYNKTIFDKLGLKVPQTIAELESACETLKSNGYTPFSLANQNMWTGSMYFMYLAARYGGVDEFNAAVAGTGSFDSPAFMYAAETIQKWVKAGYFPEGVNSLNTDDGQDRQLMYQEKAAMMLHGSWQASAMNNDDSQWYKANISYFGFPKLDTSKADQNIVVGTSIGNGFSFNTRKDTDLLNACFILATQFYNDDTYNKAQLASGTIPSIEGMGDTIQDQCMQLVWKDFSSASNVQLWYDQYLPPEVGEVHKTSCQEIFGLTKTPAEANKELNDAMQAYLKAHK